MAAWTHPRRGMLIPDTRLNPDTVVAADDLGDESAPRAGGIAAPDSASARLAIETLGDQDTDLVYQVEQGGHPELGAGVRYSYRTAAEASTARRGWNAPNLITGWTAADYSTTANTMVCALAMGNGQILVAYRAASTTAYFQTYTPDTDTWSGTIAFPATVHATGGIALAQTPEGNVVAMFRHDGGQWRIYRYSIADAVSGGSWVLHATDMLPSAPGTAATRTRLFILPSGDWAYFYGYANVLNQYASNNQGASFTLVLAGTPSASTLFDAAATPSGKIIVSIFVADDPTTYTIGSAWTPYTAVTESTVSTTNGLEVWMAADPIGRVHLYYRGSVNADDINWFYTDDDGASWQASNNDLTGNGDANTYITDGQAVHAGGAVWLCHQFSDATATQDASVCLMRLGGWSSITIGSSGLADDYWRYSAKTSVGSYEGKTYIPIALPANQTGWTNTTAGTAAATLTGGRAQIACTGGGGTYYESGALGATDDVVFQMCVNVAIGGSSTAHQAGAEFRSVGSVTDHRVGVYLTTTAITVRDVHAGTTLGSASVDMTADMEIFVYFSPNSHLFVAYKRPGTTTWTEIYEGGATTAAAAGTNYVRWGTSSSSVTTHSYRYVWYFSDDSADGPFFAASTNATYSNIIGRLLTSLPAPLDKRSAYGRKQAYVRGKDGPGRVTDTFQATTRADYPREAIMWQHAPSPRVSYKTATSGLTEMAWEPAAGSPTSVGSPILAMVVLNTNAPVHRLYGDPDDGGGYDLLGTMTLFNEFAALSYTRTGNVIRINGGTAGSRYVMAGEFVGASIDLDDTHVRRIERHTEGVWATTGRQVEIVMATSGEGAYDDTESASGTCWIYAHSGVLVLPTVNAATYKKFKWSMRGTDGGGDPTTDNKLRAGQVLIGGVEVMGQQWDWGHAIDYVAPVVETETRPGVVRRSAVAPVGRTVSIGWTEGVDQTSLRSATTTTVPDYLTGSTVGEATRGDVPFKLAGILSATRGGEVPVVLLTKIPTSNTTITDPTLFIYGRMAPEIRVENVQGDEGEDEVYRVSSVAFKEIT